MTQRILFYCATPFLMLYLSSCSTANKEIQDLQSKTITTKTIHSTDTKLNAIELQYSFILPEAYSSEEKLPVIYLLDPHANGEKPLTLYKEIANKEQVILVASRNIKNGLQQDESNAYFKALMLETKSRFNIDTKQQFVAGFSGGAKLALLFASQFNEITGAIACGGVIPYVGKQKPNFYFVGIVGKQDFNYLEVIQTQNSFINQGFDFTSIKFDGKHEWPPSESFSFGISGLKLFSIKIKRAASNKKWINKLFNQTNDSLSYFEESNQMVKAYEITQQMIRWFYNVKPITHLKKKALAIERNADFRKKVSKMQKLVQSEVVLRSEFIRSVENKNLEWWKNEAKKLNSPHQKSKEAIDVNYRLKNYISMVSFMLIKNDLDNKQLDKVLKKIKIYELVDPSNYDVYLMHARYALQINHKKEMTTYFEKAIALGFSSFSEYLNDSSWKELFKQKEIKNIISNNQ